MAEQQKKINARIQLKGGLKEDVKEFSAFPREAFVATDDTFCPIWVNKEANNGKPSPIYIEASLTDANKVSLDANSKALVTEAEMKKYDEAMRTELKDDLKDDIIEGRDITISSTSDKNIKIALDLPLTRGEGNKSIQMVSGGGVGSVEATGLASVALGDGAKAITIGSVALGRNTVAGEALGENGSSYADDKGKYAFACGGKTEAKGDFSSAEGYYTKALGNHSHAEGGGYGSSSGEGKPQYNIAQGIASHAEGKGTMASGEYSHAEGNNTKALTAASYAGGDGTIAGAKGFYIVGIDKDNKKLELSKTPASSTVKNSVNQDSSSTLLDDLQQNDVVNICLNIGDDIGRYYYLQIATIDAIENNIITLNSMSFLPDTLSTSEPADFYIFFNGVSNPANSIELSSCAHAEGFKTIALSTAAHAEGNASQAIGKYSHAEGRVTKAGYAAHSEGGYTEAIPNYSHAEGLYTKATGYAAHAEGKGTSEQYTEARGDVSHAEGYQTLASGPNSHAEGYHTEAKGNYSHAEGYQTLASGEGSHAEGTVYSSGSGASTTYIYTEATGVGAHAEGRGTKATGAAAHSEGNQTQANGNYSHAGGANSQAKGSDSQAIGRNVIANQFAQTVVGAFNKNDDEEVQTALPKDDKATWKPFVVGAGTSSTNKFNAFEVYGDGRVVAGRSTTSLDSDLTLVTLDSLKKIINQTYVLNEIVYPVGTYVTVYAQIQETVPHEFIDIPSALEKEAEKWLPYIPIANPSTIIWQSKYPNLVYQQKDVPNSYPDEEGHYPQIYWATFVFVRLN